jgi:hypothetical protein
MDHVLSSFVRIVSVKNASTGNFSQKEMEYFLVVEIDGAKVEKELSSFRVITGYSIRHECRLAGGEWKWCDENEVVASAQDVKLRKELLSRMSYWSMKNKLLLEADPEGKTLEFRKAEDKNSPITKNARVSLEFIANLVTRAIGCVHSETKDFELLGDENDN